MADETIALGLLPLVPVLNLFKPTYRAWLSSTMLGVSESVPDGLAHLLTGRSRRLEVLSDRALLEIQWLRLVTLIWCRHNARSGLLATQLHPATGIMLTEVAPDARWERTGFGDRAHKRGSPAKEQLPRLMNADRLY